MDRLRSRSICRSSSFKKTLLFLPPDKFGTVNSLTWAPDNVLLVSCSEKLLLINIVLVQNPRFLSSQDIFTTVIEEVLTIQNIPDYCLSRGVLDFETSFLHLSDAERQLVMTDPALIDFGFLQFSASKIWKKAICSAFPDTFCRQHYLISCMTYDYRVFIFTKDDQSFKPFECTDWIKKHVLSTSTLPIVLKKRKDLQDYISLMYDMASVEILWTQLFSTDACASFFLLITGTRNGNVHMWKIDANFSGKESQFSWKFTDKYGSEVMSLAWLTLSQAKGVLAIGYVDGSVRCLEVAAIFDGDLFITATEILVDRFCDGLSVADIAFGKTSQETDVMIACKQHFLHLFTITGTTVKYCNYFLTDAALPLTSICLKGMYGVVSPQDCALIAIEIQETEGKISVIQRKQDFDMLIDNPGISWLCKGSALSPSCALCFSLLKTDHNSLAMKKKRKVTGNQMILMSVPFSLELEKMMYNLRDPLISTKDTVLNFCLLIKDEIASVEETFKIHQLPDVLTSLQEINCNRGNQVTLAAIKFLKALLLSQNLGEKDLEWLSIACEEALKKRMYEYAVSCLDNLPSVNSSLDLMIVSSFQKLLRDGENSLELKLSEKSPEHTSNHCPVCGSDILDQ
ncbi:proteinral transcription factor 3c polypeptide 4 [Plakobranchus ocellatus]|uniref:Proteinral transcription factor 3c polypeptide 4 n=1 Tax=Plakobranchus ocellatus TaxID=259542 RepID=A0AAV3Z7Q3_9GAST|nr:proteinral transcription factor 3c polypeptide 4 [Plakobranchus ocellatus]